MAAEATLSTKVGLVPLDASASRDGMKVSIFSSPSEALSLMRALDRMAAMSLRRSPAIVFNRQFSAFNRHCSFENYVQVQHACM